MFAFGKNTKTFMHMNCITFFPVEIALSKTMERFMCLRAHCTALSPAGRGTLPTSHCEVGWESRPLILNAIKTASRREISRVSCLADRGAFLYGL